VLIWENRVATMPKTDGST